MKRWLLLTAVLIVGAGSFFLFTAKKSEVTSGDSAAGSSVSPAQAESTAIKQSETDAAREEQFTLRGSNDYAALKAYFEPQAKKGDPYANRVIAQIYDYCAMYSSPSYHFNETIDAMIKQKPENKARLEIIRKEKNERCSTLDNGLPITKELIDLSWAQASAAKDPLATLKISAQMQIKHPEQAPQGKDLDSLVERAIGEGDSEAIFTAGELLGLSDSSIAYADVSGPISQFAWQIAACRQGGQQMCGQGSMLMTTLCLNLGDCTSQNFEVMARNSIPHSQAELLNNALIRIEHLLQQQGAAK